MDIKKLKKAAGFTLIELLVVIAILGILMAALVFGAPQWIRGAKMTAASQNGKKLFDAITAKNLSYAAGSRKKTIWPKTESSTGGGSSTRIWNKSYKDSREYFEDLFDVKNITNPSKRRSYLEEDVKLVYDQVEAPSDPTKLEEDNVMWCVAANMEDDDPGAIVALITRNVKCDQLLEKYSGTDTDTEISVGLENGADYDEPFSNKGFVFVRKDGGAVKVDDVNNFTYEGIYEGQTFDATTKKNKLVYLTPKGTATPTSK